MTESVCQKISRPISPIMVWFIKPLVLVPHNRMVLLKERIGIFLILLEPYSVWMSLKCFGLIPCWLQPIWWLTCHLVCLGWSLLSSLSSIFSLLLQYLDVFVLFIYPSLTGPNLILEPLSAFPWGIILAKKAISVFILPPINFLFIWMWPFMSLFCFFSSRKTPLWGQHVSEEAFSLPLLVPTYAFDVGSRTDWGMGDSCGVDGRIKGETVVVKDFLKVYSRKKESYTR